MSNKPLAPPNPKLPNYEPKAGHVRGWFWDRLGPEPAPPESQPNPEPITD